MRTPQRDEDGTRTVSGRVTGPGVLSATGGDVTVQKGTAGQYTLKVPGTVLAVSALVEAGAALNYNVTFGTVAGPAVTFSIFNASAVSADAGWTFSITYRPAVL